MCVCVCVLMANKHSGYMTHFTQDDNCFFFICLNHISTLVAYQMQDLVYIYIYIYIYTVIHRQICFVLSELISVARQ